MPNIHLNFAWPLSVVLAAAVYAVLVILSLSNDTIAHQDEAYYLSAMNTMTETGDYLVPRFDNEARIHKPIGYYWLILPGQMIFGHSFFTTRLVSLLSSVALLAVAWKITAFFFDDHQRRIAAIWMLASADMFFRYAHYSVPEMTLTFWMVLAHWAFLCYERERSTQESGRRYLLAFYAFMGAAFMIKGPVGIILPLSVGMITFLVQGCYREILRMLWLPGLGLMVLVIAPWYLMLVHRFGWERIFQMIRSETGGRTGLNFGNLLFFVPVCLAFYLPWTVFLLDRFKLATIKAAAGQVARSHLFIWFITYFVFYSVLVSEKHQWYALQWAVPWVLLLTRAMDFRVSNQPDRTIFRAFPVAAIVLAMICLALYLMFGQIMASATAVGALVAITLASGLILAMMRRPRFTPLHRVMALATTAMVVHTVVFALFYTTTQLRPVMKFARHLQQQDGPFNLLIGDRYCNKKLRGYNFSGLEPDALYKPKMAEFVETLEEQKPDYVVCRQRRLEDKSVSVLLRSYRIEAEGYVRKKGEHKNGMSDWLAMVKSREPKHVFDLALLLQRQDEVSGAP